MLRVILVHAPGDDAATAALTDELASTPLSEVYAPPGLLDVAHTLGSRHRIEGVPDQRLGEPEGALRLIEGVAERSEGTILLIVEEAVARAVVTHALDAPVVQERLALDPGAFAEIEVRLDSPWTVNRLNDRCHLDERAVE